MTNAAFDAVLDAIDNLSEVANLDAMAEDRSNDPFGMGTAISLRLRADEDYVLVWEVHDETDFYGSAVEAAMNLGIALVKADIAFNSVDLSPVEGYTLDDLDED